MTTKCIFHKGDQVRFLPAARENCIPRVRELVDRLNELPALTVATSIGRNVNHIRILEDGKTYGWPIEWFELSKPFKPVPIDDLI